MSWDDDAEGWYFAGVTPDSNTPAQKLQKEILAPVLGVEPEDVELTGLGLGGLAYLMIMSLNDYATQMNERGHRSYWRSVVLVLEDDQGPHFVRRRRTHRLVVALRNTPRFVHSSSRSSSTSRAKASCPQKTC